MDILLISTIVLMLILGLIIFLYIWVFAVVGNNINSSNNNLLALALENMSIENYLVPNDSAVNLMAIYETPATNPYLDITYFYQNSPTGLVYTITDSSGRDVTIETINLKDNNKYVKTRLFFVNTKSNLYNLKYALDNISSNNRNVEIIRIELKV